MAVRLRCGRRDRWPLGVRGGTARACGLSRARVRPATVLVAIAIPSASVFPTFLAYFARDPLYRASEEF